MLEQIKTMKYKKHYAYNAGGGVILAILYILISVYITSLAYKTIINMPEISPKDYGLEYEKVEFHTTGNAQRLDKYLYADQLSYIRPGWIADVKSRKDGRPFEVSFTDKLGFTYFYYHSLLILY